MPRSQIKTQTKEKRINNYNEVSLGLPKKFALEEARRFPQCANPDDNPKCPLSIDIPGFIRILREGDPMGALAKIKEENAFPSICGRVCTAPCEKDFSIKHGTTSVSIRALERFVADHGQQKIIGRKRSSPIGKKVAVIGSGPCGLKAAVQLAKNNYRVTIFESFPKAGGRLRYDLAPFQMPSKILEDELREAELLGIKIITGCSIGYAVTLDDIFTSGFEAILLSVGQGAPEFSKMKGDNISGIFHAQELLMSVNMLDSNLSKNKLNLNLGEKVAVIGSNAQAIDCARICARLVSEVSLLFESTQEDLRAYPLDIQYAIEEGIRMEGAVRPIECTSDENGRINGLKCAQLDYADPDSTGKWELHLVPDTEFSISVDSIVIASDKEPKVSIEMIAKGIQLNEYGSLWTNEGNGMTSVDKVFAAGDVIKPNGDIINAIVSGKEIAEKIDKYLRG